MAIRSKADPKRAVIAANLQLLQSLLRRASRASAEAHRHILAGERNGAIGVVAGIDADLVEALALYRSVLAHHRDRSAQRQRMHRSKKSGR